MVKTGSALWTISALGFRLEDFVGEYLGIESPDLGPKESKSLVSGPDGGMSALVAASA
jgi:hypothetical protein